LREKARGKEVKRENVYDGFGLVGRAVVGFNPAWTNGRILCAWPGKICV
jgi:hypothetical protein